MDEVLSPNQVISEADAAYSAGDYLQAAHFYKISAEWFGSSGGQNSMLQRWRIIAVWLC